MSRCGAFLVSSSISDGRYIYGISVPCSLIILLLNDDSQLLLYFSQRRYLFLGLTAAKKMLIQRWKPPHSLHITQWIALLYDIITSELSIACSNGAMGLRFCPRQWRRLGYSYRCGTRWLIRFVFLF